MGILPMRGRGVPPLQASTGETPVARMAGDGHATLTANLKLL